MLRYRISVVALLLANHLSAAQTTTDLSDVLYAKHVRAVSVSPDGSGSTSMTAVHPPKTST
jgi:hypothetical protein